ncbi:hypothetical protein CVS28_13450 [Arthrobacter glacialis]|nr:hypothetical protein CVS28_13450 [Arthrobacter glacialis]
MAAGTVDRDIPANQSLFFAPVIDPTLSMGVRAHVAAKLACARRRQAPSCFSGRGCPGRPCTWRGRGCR